MTPRWRVRAAWALLVVCLIAWPVTALTVAREEPQFILGLSWTALILTSLDIISTSDVRKEQEGEDGEAG